MAFSWGAALTQFGKDAPVVGASVDNIFDERYKRKRQGAIDERQAILDSLTANEGQLKLDVMKDEIAKRDEGRDAFNKYSGDKSAIDQAKMISGTDTIEPGQYAGPLAPGEVDRLSILSKLKPDEMMDKYKLPYYAAYDPGLKNMLTKETGKLGIGASVYQMKKDDLARIRAMPEGPEKEAAWEDFLMNSATGTAFGLSPEGIELASKRAGATGYAGAKGRTQAEMDVGGGVNPVTNDLKVDLRNEFTNAKEIGNISSVYQNFNKAKNAFDLYSKGKIAPYEVDQSLAYYASKALDPNSVVMPGEFDRFAKGLGYQTAQAMVEQLLNGGLKLTDDQRRGMMNIVERSWNSAKDAAAPVREFYIKQAQKNNLDPYDVTGKYDYIFAEKKQPKQLDKSPSEGKTSASSYLDEIRKRRAAKGGK